MKQSLRSRTLIAIIALIILAFLIGLLLCITLINRYYIVMKDRDMLRLYDGISSVFSTDDYSWGSYYGHDNQKHKKIDDPETPNSEPMTIQDLEVLCDELSITILVLDPSGKEMFSYGNRAKLLDRLDELTLNLETDYSSHILESTDRYTVQTVSRDNSSELDYLEMWGTLSSQYSFIARSSFSGIENSVKMALIFFCFVCAIIVIIAAFIIYALAHSYSKPLKKLVAATESATNMDFADLNRNLQNAKRKDELSILGENIFEMSNKLEKTMSELKSSNLKLTNELKAKAELDEQRKKYISDISHELKTPIALISGYAEGLKEGVGGSKEDQDYYLDVIIDEAEKMNLMVKRISSLNKLEQGQGDVDLQRFNVVEVINGYLNTMALIFDEKGIQIYFNDKDIIYVWSDEFLFEEVLMNYLNNALNHVDENKMISIKVEPIGNCARVTVFNTGKPIPEEDISKIWGEFYKVDKARTREYGGSGLGLSIVKAIADTLDKKCGVYNTDTGVAFWIDLELDKVQVYGEVDMKKKAAVKMSDLPIWKTTTKILRDTSKRLEAQAKEQAEKNAQRKEERAEKNAQRKEERAEKEAQRKEERAEKEAQRKEERAEKEAQRKEERAEKEAQRKEERAGKSAKKKEERAEKRESKKEES